MSSSRIMCIGLGLTLGMRLAAENARGDSYVFDGGGDGTSWYDSKNWDPNGVPGYDDDALIQGGWTVRVVGESSVGNVTISGATLRIEGRSMSSSTSLEVHETCTNNGTIELTTVDNPSGAILSVGNGHLVNTGVINTLLGAGGTTRWIVAAVQNQGEINIGTETYIYKQSGPVDHSNAGTINLVGGDLHYSYGTLANSGTINVGGGRTLNLGVYQFHNSGGSFAGAGTVRLLGVTVIGPGTLTNPGSLAQMTMQGCAINAPFVNGGLVALYGENSIDSAAGAFYNASGATLRQEAGYGGSVSNLTVASGFTNDGRIELTNTIAGTADILKVTSGALVNQGTIDILPGAGGGWRFLQAELDNRCTLNVGLDLRIGPYSAVSLTNSGTINLTGGNLEQSLSAHSFTNTGVINISSGRTLKLWSGLFAYDGGAVNGPGRCELSSVTLNLGTGFVNALEEMELTNTTVNGPGTLTNATQITMSSGAINAPLVNQGLLAIDSAAIKGPFLNEGLLVTSSTTVSSPAGSFTNAAGATLRIEGKSGRNGMLTVSNGFANAGAIELTNATADSASSLTVTSGTLINTGTIAVLPGAGGGLRRLYTALDNQGELNIDAAATIDKSGSASHNNSGSINVTGGDLTLSLTSDTFTNAGALYVGPGRTLTVNYGTFRQTAGSLVLDNASLTSSVLVDVQGGELAGNGAIHGNVKNAGTVAPGLSPGQLSISGTYTQLASGVLEVELGGSNPGSEFDALVVGGSATLDGTLYVDVLDPYEPPVGAAFTVLTAAARTGTFGTVQAPCLAGGGRFVTNYTATGVELAVAPALRGDMNCDCVISYADINPFVLALSAPAGYAAQYPACSCLNADINADGLVSYADINPFVRLLSGG